MSCNCEPKKYGINMGCCQPVLGPIENYYTKNQIDRMIDEIEQSGCCITEEEVDEKIESAKTEIESEIPSLSGYATEQWVEDKHYITGVDLSNYATFDELPELTDYATKPWVISLNYATNSELIQYVTNLQNQIDSLKSQVSGCCGSSGETITRWITMTGKDDYICSGTTKMTKEKEQQSTDGGNTWTDTGNYRNGSTILEENSTDCGYVASLKFRGVLRNNYGTIEVPCNSSSTLTKGEVYTTIGYQTIEIGDCVTTIAEKAFLNETLVSELTIPSGVTTIERMAFDKIGGSEQVNEFRLTLNEGLVTIGDFGFAASKNLKDVIIPNTVQTIGNGAFESCNSLSSVTIGSCVTSIGNAAFSKSSGETQLNSVTILAVIPPTIVTNTFGGSNCPIYVPAQSVETYKTASGWSTYASRIQAIP